MTRRFGLIYGRSSLYPPQQAKLHETGFGMCHGQAHDIQKMPATSATKSISNKMVGLFYF